MNLITCDHLTMRYEGQTPAVSDLNFRVEEGDYLYIIGENGAGKSTLMKGLLGLKKPTSGSISLHGGLKRTEIGYLPQTESRRNFPASVREVVLSGRVNRMGLRPFYSAADRRSAAENMKKMGIDDLARCCFSDLSGGQQQRVLLARALCATKELLLLDEPVSGLDPLAMREMYDLIARINREMGITVIMVSHDIRAALKYAKHILQIDRRQLFYGTAASYSSSEAGRRYLRKSGDSEFLAAVRRFGAAETLSTPLPRKSPEGGDR